MTRSAGARPEPACAEALVVAAPAWRRALLRWYDRVARDLPWRRSRDPYAIWVSEVMLQQTRVDTVVPYHQRFMARFGDVRALASAPLDEVLRLWSGLGYYRRARQLHLAAGEVVAQHGGVLPSDVDALRLLTGVGPYTAGAIASIAFDRPEPIVDGNVIRVLSRLCALGEDMRKPRAQRQVWDVAARLVPRRGAGRFNQALMELGATVCTPKGAQCGACPVSRWCAALKSDRVAHLPVFGAKKTPLAVSRVAAVVRCGPLLLLAQRRPEGLFGGMWEPPMVDAEALASAREDLSAHGVPRGASMRDLGEVRHILTHRAMRVVVAGATTSRRWRLPAEPPPPYAQVAWRTPDAVALSTLARKVLRRAEPQSRTAS